MERLPLSQTAQILQVYLFYIFGKWQILKVFLFKSDVSLIICVI